MSRFWISELTRRTGVSASTLRFYEQAGLLPAERTASGYRMYDEEAVRRLEFIGAAKHLGLPLEEIRDLLRAWQDGLCAAVRTRLQRSVADRIAETDQRIAELSSFAGHLAVLQEKLASRPPVQACGPSCGCMPAALPGVVSVDQARNRR